MHHIRVRFDIFISLHLDLSVAKERVVRLEGVGNLDRVRITPNTVGLVDIHFDILSLESVI